MAGEDERPWLAPQGDRDAVHARMEPLRCARCGAPVALQATEQQRCSSCLHDNKLPEEYSGLQKAKQKYDSSMREAARVYERLSEPPGFLLRAWVGAAEQITGVVAVLVTLILIVNWVGVVVALALVYLALHSLADTFGINWNDVYGAHWIYFAGAAAFSVAVVLPQVLTAWARDAMDLRATLQGSLAARFPVQTAGQAACRGCTAPLDVPAGAACVRCPFCESDNLTAIPRERLAAIAGFARWHYRSAEEAARRERQYRRARRGGFVHWCLGTVLAGAGAAGFGGLLQAVDLDPDPPAWRELTVRPAALVVDERGVAFASVPYGVPVAAPLDGVLWWMALRRGDTVRLTAATLDGLGTPGVVNTTSFEGPALADDLAWRPADGRGFVAAFHAPYTGRFALRPRFADGTTEPPTVRLDLASR